jgi:hypothetical protein
MVGNSFYMDLALASGSVLRRKSSHVYWQLGLVDWTLNLKKMFLGQTALFGAQSCTRREW